MWGQHHCTISCLLCRVEQTTLALFSVMKEYFIVGSAESPLDCIDNRQAAGEQLNDFLWDGLLIYFQFKAQNLNFTAQFPPDRQTLYTPPHGRQSRGLINLPCKRNYNRGSCVIGNIPFPQTMHSAAVKKYNHVAFMRLFNYWKKTVSWNYVSWSLSQHHREPIIYQRADSRGIHLAFLCSIMSNTFLPGSCCGRSAQRY